MNAQLQTTTSAPAQAARPRHCAWQLRLDNEPAALSRVLLVFSRRRLPVTELHFHDSAVPGSPAELLIETQCNDASARDVELHLQKIVEVVLVAAVQVKQPA